jgi:hypothetical protein
MKILKTEHADDCVEGSNVKDIYLNDNITEDFINYIAKLGKLFYFDGINKPYFKVIVRSRFTIKSTEGNNILRILLPELEQHDYIPEIIDYIELYNKNI